MSALRARAAVPPPREDELYNVLLADLHVGPYNRVLSENHVCDLVQIYRDRPWAVPPLECNLREDGRLFVINGQHRAEAARRLSWLSLKAVVHFGWTEQQEAQSFRDSARGKNIGALDAWWAAYLAGEEDVVALTAMCTRVGVEIPRSFNGRRQGQYLTSVASLRAVAYGTAHGQNYDKKRFDLARAEAVVVFCRDTWPESKDRFDGRLMRLFGAFFRKFQAHPAFDLQEAARKLSVYDAQDVLRRSQLLAHTESIDLITAGVRVLTGLYDKARRGVRLMPVEQEGEDKGLTVR
jgi:hypothetical protein